MRIHMNLRKALGIVLAVEKVMADNGLHIHGLSGADLQALTAHALTEGQNVVSGVKALGLEAKAAASAPEVRE